MGRICRLIVRGKDWYCNIPVTRIERVEDVVYTYLDGDFTGMFDLGTVDALYITEDRRDKE